MVVSFDYPELRGGQVVIPMRAENNTFEIEFNTNIESLVLDGDSIAAALMPIIGTRQSFFNFSISETMKSTLEKRTGKEVGSSSHPPPPP